VAIKTHVGLFAALSAGVNGHEDRRFFIFTRRVKLIVRRASFSKPWTRRMLLRNALGFAMFMRRFRTHLVPVNLSR